MGERLRLGRWRGDSRPSGERQAAATGLVGTPSFPSLWRLRKTHEACDVWQVAAFDSSRVEVVSVTGSLAPERGSSVVLFRINLPNVAAGNVAAQPLEEDLDPILNEVAVNAAWGTTINNLGARVCAHRCQTLLDCRWFGRRATG